MKIKGTKTYLILLALTTLTSLICVPVYGKIKAKEKPVGSSPTCTSVGELNCPKGYKPSCPKQYKPSCVFAGNKQIPACLADSPDRTFYSFKLDIISCKKL